MQGGETILYAQSEHFKCCMFTDLPDGSFQTEASIREELPSLKTCLKIHKVDNSHLQVPFPPLNKTLPAQHRFQPTPAVGSEAVTLESTQTSTAMCTTVLVGDRTAHESGGGNNEDRGVATNPPSNMSLPTVDWSTLAKQLIAVLEKAVRSRVVRAPYQPSSALDDAKSGVSKFTHGRARIAILFSGGVDSVLLAALADRYTHVISLLS